MRFVVLVKATKESEAGLMPDTKTLSAPKLRRKDARLRKAAERR